MVVKQRWLAALIVAALAAAPAYSAWAQSPASQPAPEAIGSATEVTVHGKIAAVDKANKTVTLEGPQGHKVTLKVENPYNLKAAKVGEPVVAKFYEIVTVRKEKPGEKIPAASVKEGLATASPGETPGAVATRQTSILLKVTAIDLAKGTVTVQAPDGSEETVKARNPQNLKLIKVGQNLVVTFVRAVGISLAKEH